jgi:hypothetical protein
VPHAAQRGAALALVLWALVIGGALLTVTVLLAVEEQRAGLAARHQQQAFIAAEERGATSLSRWTAGALRARLPRPFDSLPLDGGPGWEATVRRLTGAVFLLEVSAGGAPDEPRPRQAASVRMGWLARAQPESLTLAGAASVGGSALLGDGVLMSGFDEPPPGRGDCPPADSAVPGIAGAAVSLTGSATLAGSPPQLLRGAADSGLAPVDLGSYRRFASRATLILPGGGTYATNPATVGTACDLQQSQNWGDPFKHGAPCGGYLPIIEVEGDLTLMGGAGQGILLVDGNLTVLSDYTFFGLVMVKGGIDVQANLEVRGALAAAILGSETRQLTRTTVRYSKCIISNVLDSATPLTPLQSRAWKQLF